MNQLIKFNNSPQTSSVQTIIFNLQNHCLSSLVIYIIVLSIVLSPEITGYNKLYSCPQLNSFLNTMKRRILKIFLSLKVENTIFLT